MEEGKSVHVCLLNLTMAIASSPVGQVGQVLAGPIFGSHFCCYRYALTHPECVV